MVQSRNCWYTLLSSYPPNVGVQDLDLTAINNIGRTRRWARSKKKNRVGWKCPNYFCLRL